MKKGNIDKAWSGANEEEIKLFRVYSSINGEYDQTGSI